MAWGLAGGAGLLCRQWTSSGGEGRQPEQGSPPGGQGGAVSRKMTR